MANELKRTYNIPLRREFMKVPKYKRAKKAITALKQFVKRHMKIDNLENIKIGKHLNEEIWKHSIKNPPHHVKVNILKDLKENKAIVELFEETKNSSLLEADFVVRANDVFHLISEKVKDKKGRLDGKEIFFQYKAWLKKEGKRMEGGI